MTLDPGSNVWVADGGLDYGDVAFDVLAKKVASSARDGQSAGPGALALDGAGHEYVTSHENYRIQKFWLRPPLAQAAATTAAGAWNEEMGTRSARVLTRRPSSYIFDETPTHGLGSSSARGSFFFDMEVAVLMDRETLQVAVIGAGPVGLAAAAQLLAHGQEPVVFEVGPGAGTSLLAWGHVRVFSPWGANIDAAARGLLERHGWNAPDADGFPTGRELVEHYLAPLAALPELRDRIRYQRRVVAVARQGLDKMTTPDREQAPFVVTVRDADGVVETMLAKAVVDASGTYATPNPLGAAGVPVPGEQALADRIFYGIPDPLGTDRARYAGKRVVVVGSGHSAMNILLDVLRLKSEEPATRITWAVRREGRRLAHLYGGGADDMLPERGKLGYRVKQAIAGERVTLVTGFKTERMRLTDDGIVVASATEELPPVDEIVAATGFRPDLSFLSEIRLGLDSAVESPVALAPLIDPNIHSCGSVPPHGAEELRHPEPDFYMVGMKSYGRAPTFLMMTGYEQVRSVAAAIAGDWDAAREVRLELPQTGVCSADLAQIEEDTTKDLVHVGAAPQAIGCCS